MFKLDIVTTVAVLLIAPMGGGRSVQVQSPFAIEAGPRIVTELPSPVNPMGPEMHKALPKLNLASLPIAAPGTYQNTYEWGNCTWYVASRVKVPENLGNANTWADIARGEGKITGLPIVGAVAQSTAGYYGHVAVVMAVDAGQVQVDEMNVKGLGVASEAWYPVSHFNNYIYF